MSDSLTLANARLVFEDRIVPGTLEIADGLIRAVTPGTGVPAGAVDCAGDLVLPGLVELHTDNLERHLAPRPGVDWPHDAAILAHDAELAACGITTVFDALRVGSISSPTGMGYGKYARALASEIHALRDAGHLRISHHLHLRAEMCSQTLTEELSEFTPADRVGLVSLMDHTPGQRQFVDVDKFRQYVQGKYGLPDQTFLDYVAELEEMQRVLKPGHEAAAVAAARRFGATLASHDDTTPEHVRESAGLGVGVAEFPTTRAAAEESRRAGIAVMMGAPNIIRGGSHSGNVAAADLWKAGLLDILSSDYVPAALLTAALRMAGMTGDLAGALGTVTSAPARAVGLTDRGRLAPGLRADVLRLREVGRIARPVAVWCAGTRVA